MLRYAPLSVRIVEQALKPGGCVALEDALKLLPGGHFDVSFAAPEDDEGAAPSMAAAGGAQLRHLPTPHLPRQMDESSQLSGAPRVTKGS